MDDDNRFRKGDSAALLRTDGEPDLDQLLAFWEDFRHWILP
jgi:hypothetical protein